MQTDRRHGSYIARRAGQTAAILLSVLALSTCGFWAGKGEAPAALPLPAYNVDTAMTLAGDQVPDDIESFYFFVLQPEAPEESAELAGFLLRAAFEHEFLGITGSDPEHNYEVLVAAIASIQRPDLAGLVLIYVGPAEEQLRVEPMVTATGAELRFVTYPAALEAADTI